MVAVEDCQCGGVGCSECWGVVEILNGPHDHTSSEVPEAPVTDVPDVSERTLFVGDHVKDCEDENGATMVVVRLTLQRAASYMIGDDRTVADVNPGYPEEEPVAEVVFPQRTDAFLCEKPRYAYPEARLERVTPVHEIGEEEEDDDG